MEHKIRIRIVEEDGQWKIYAAFSKQRPNYQHIGIVKKLGDGRWQGINENDPSSSVINRDRMGAACELVGEYLDFERLKKNIQVNQVK